MPGAVLGPWILQPPLLVNIIFARNFLERGPFFQMITSDALIVEFGHLLLVSGDVLLMMLG